MKSRWIAYSKIHLKKELSFKIIQERLESLDKVWSSSSPTTDETEMLKNSFNSFIERCFTVVSIVHKYCRLTQNRYGLTKLEKILR
jgi:hypothetical protein